ncbi:YbbR-like domain-containing protein [Abyssicoccus albus]|uniref:CdaR family protein n=1 Tax=Abyssicoccus albus TaxID=1817405 RepID=UPI00097E2865|nr:CdaR family protein [Abyssicoccus albus]AQL56778.1 hypothetical protein BVH56_07520 [Abyssicoccus albus]
MLENKWGLRFIAFLLALFLFLSVNDVFDNLFGEGQYNGEQTTTIKNVPVDAQYDKENLYVSGLPESVDIEISGPKSIVKRTSATQDFTITTDLSNLNTGDHNVSFEAENISDKLEYSIKPTESSITIEELVTERFDVEAEVNNSRIATGYELVGESSKPTQVSISGGKSEISRISYVKATLSSDTKINQDVTEKAEVNVFDANLNKLNVTVKPATITVNIDVQETSKTVSLNPNIEGEVKKGYALDKVSLDTSQVKLYGDRETLDKIGTIDVPVDVNDLSNDSTIKVDIPLPENISKAEPKEIEAKVIVKKENE